ncbi:uncharacterized protein LOC114526606 [Dendronephthya gigantea]|uniref:uncharacterized protein LOC114526606 n=1 Tax=Dendronephthya gigantea TaxID=151771 RepID=UPI00106CC6D6|nr:uncharacterized protein LOC114526606 [Dendronephthya gigantea]
MNKDNYFLNMMQPATHVFMKRLLVHLQNKKKNNEEIGRQEQALQKHGLVAHTTVDSLGRIIIAGNIDAAFGTHSSDENTVSSPTGNVNEARVDNPWEKEELTEEPDVRFIPRGLENPPKKNRCFVNSLLQCLASCIPVKSPSGSDLSWLLFYLARTYIEVRQEDVSQKLESLASKLVNSNDPDDPGDFLYSLLRYTSSVGDEALQSACRGVERVQLVC